MTLESSKNKLDMSKINDRAYYIACISGGLITSDWIMFNNGKINQMVWLNHAKKFEKQHNIALQRGIQEVEKIIFNKTESTPSDWRGIGLQPAALLKKSTQKSNLIVQTKKKITTNLHQTTLQEKPTRPKKKRTRKVKQTTQQKTTTAEKMLYDLVISKTPKKLLKNQYGIGSRRLYTTMLGNLCKTIANGTRRKLSFLRHTKNSFLQKRSAP